MFAEKGFNDTGNHNKYVNPYKKTQNERGARKIHMDFSKIKSKKPFKVSLAAEPYILKKFFTNWEVLFYLLLIFLAVFMAFGYALQSLGKDVMKERAIAKSIIPNYVWGIAELYDLYKDLRILFTILHSNLIKWVMILSIILPITISDAVSARNNLIHNFMTHIGFTKTLRDVWRRSNA